MATSYVRGTIPRWQFTDGTSRWNAGGKMYFREHANPDNNKDVYQDSQGLIPWSNPIILNSDLNLIK